MRIRAALLAGACSVPLLLAGSARATPGDLDTSFNFDGKVTTLIGGESEARGLALQPDGRIVATGWALGSNFDVALARYAANGSLDPSFGTGGEVTTPIGPGDDMGLAVALQPDGRIVVAGHASNGSNLDNAVVRYNANGTLDTSFGAGGKVTTAVGSGNDEAYAVAVQPNGRIVTGGYAPTASNNDFLVARYNPNGTLDTTFNPGGTKPGTVTTDFGGGNDAVNGIAVQPDGKVVAAGQAVPPLSLAEVALARYNADGSLDTSFGNGGKVTTSINPFGSAAEAVAVEPDGRIVVAGYTSTDGNTRMFLVARYKSDGSPDTSFGSGGIAHADLGDSTQSTAFAVGVEPDGRILVAGNTRVGGNYRFGLARFNPSGSLDPSFGSGGLVTTSFGGNDAIARALVLQPDGRAVAGGAGAVATDEFGLARYLGGGSSTGPELTSDSAQAPPGGSVDVRGAGFGDYELVDLYFDTTGEALVSADGSGSFNATIPIPAAAASGPHWLTAGGRATGLSAQTSIQVGVDWPMFRFGPAHTGVNPSESALSTASVHGLHLLWRTKLGTGGSHQAPVEMNGVVYGVGPSAVYALDARTGHQAWVSASLTAPSQPAVSGDGVFVSSGNNLYALDPATGVLRWAFALGAGAAGGPATVANGVVYVGTTTGKVYAVNAANGLRLSSAWPYTAGGSITAAPAVDDGTVYIGSSDGKVYAFDAQSAAGLLGWPVTAGASANFVASPAVDAGTLVVGGQDDKVYAFDGESGAALWTATLGGAVESSAALGDGMVWVGADDNKLYALDEDTGVVDWSTSSLGANVTSSPAVANGVAYVTVPSKKKLYAFDAASGGPKLASLVTKSGPSSPIVVDGGVFLTTTAGLQAFRAAPPAATKRPDPLDLRP
jgi:uncharacterized delta-60 repeat protein